MGVQIPSSSVVCVCFLFWVTSHHDKNVADMLTSAELHFCCYTSANELALFLYHGAILSRGLTMSMLSLGAEVTLNAIFLLLYLTFSYRCQHSFVCVSVCKRGLVGYFVCDQWGPNRLQA